MTEEVNPMITGTLSRGRHLAYQGVILAVYLIAFAITGTAEKAGWWLVGDGIWFLASWFLAVKRLHDAGHSGVWSLPVAALYATATIIYILAEYYPSVDETASDGGFLGNFGVLLAQEQARAEAQAEAFALAILPYIGWIVGSIAICALPTKQDDNPYKLPDLPE